MTETREPTRPARGRKAPPGKKPTTDEAPPPAAPGRDVTLDLDALDKAAYLGPEKVQTKPFVFRHGGRDWELIDPRDLDWQEGLDALRHPLGVIQFALAETDRGDFLQVKLPSWKLGAVFEAWRQHYDLPSAGEALALLDSSTGTARR